MRDGNGPAPAKSSIARTPGGAAAWGFCSGEYRRYGPTTTTDQLCRKRGRKERKALAGALDMSALHRGAHHRNVEFMHRALLGKMLRVGHQAAGEVGIDVRALVVPDARASGDTCIIGSCG